MLNTLENEVSTCLGRRGKVGNLPGKPDGTSHLSHFPSTSQEAWDTLVKENQKVKQGFPVSREFSTHTPYSFLAVLIDLGLAAVVVDGKLRVFGFSSMDPEEARKAGAWIREHAAELVAEITATDVFEARRPGYCRTCPAHVKGWEILQAGKRHTEWCVHSAWFLGKAGKPIPLERFEPGIEALKLKKGRCPLRGAK